MLLSGCEEGCPERMQVRDRAVSSSTKRSQRCEEGTWAVSLAGALSCFGGGRWIRWTANVLGRANERQASEGGRMVKNDATNESTGMRERLLPSYTGTRNRLSQQSSGDPSIYLNQPG